MGHAGRPCPVPCSYAWRAGVPDFSGIDMRENAKFVPDFCKVAPQCLHGAIVLSDNAARGQVWLDRNRPHTFIAEFTEVGAPLRTWSAA